MGKTKAINKKGLKEGSLTEIESLEISWDGLIKIGIENPNWLTGSQIKQICIELKRYKIKN